MVGTGKKIIQFGILVILEAQEINLTGNLWGSECDEYWIFLWEVFSFYKKVPSRLVPVLSLEGFFEVFLPQTPVMFSTDLH